MNSKVYISREIADRLANHQGIRKALKEFAKNIENGKAPKRVYKSSGVNKRGERFDPYINLRLWHHHLGRKSDPLLVVQKIYNEESKCDDVYTVAITTHEAVFGDGMLWLQENAVAIYWGDCLELKAAVDNYQPPSKSHKP